VRFSPGRKGNAAARRNTVDHMRLDRFALAKPLLHKLDPETAHELTLRALEAGLVPPQPAVDDQRLSTAIFGRTLPHPLGLAAGFDKNARVFRQMFAQGFAVVEVGGVTPRPQKGNPRPRVFRLPEDAAVINRMGFPGEGADVVLARLRSGGATGMLGVNLATNADSADPAADFVELVRRFAPYADFLTLDVSCPNTANGQLFLEPAALRDLLARLAALDFGPRAPAVVAKLSPDIDQARLEALVAVLRDARISAISIGNTTTARPPLVGDGSERGGLSGKPLLAPSTAMLAAVRALTAGAIPLIGVGGVASGADAYAKIRAGATIVQLYTALIYDGPALVTKIKRDLAVFLLRDGFATAAEAVGR
jgi:dihydroorotate dehydrogenase